MRAIREQFGVRDQAISKEVFGPKQITIWLERFSAEEMLELLTNEINSQHGDKAIAQAHSKFTQFPNPRTPNQEQLYARLNTNDISCYADGILRQLPLFLKQAISTRDIEKIYQITMNAKAVADWIINKVSAKQQEQERRYAREQRRLHEACTIKQIMER